MCGFMASQRLVTEPDERDGARISVGIDEIIAAATALTWAAGYDVARRLLDSAVCAVDGDAAARHLALTAAATAVHHDFRTVGPRWAPGAIAAAEAVTETQDRWRLDFLELQHDYGRELIGPDGSPAIGREGRDPARAAALGLRAETLAASAADVADAGWAAFYRGLIDDNLAGDSAAPSGGSPRRSAPPRRLAMTTWPARRCGTSVITTRRPASLPWPGRGGSARPSSGRGSGT